MFPEICSRCFLSIRLSLWALYKLTLNIWSWTKTWKYNVHKCYWVTVLSNHFLTPHMCSHDHFRNIWGCRRSVRRPPLAAEGRWVLMGVWKMSLLPIWLTEWLITTRGGEELRRGRGSDCNEGRGEALKANQSHRLRVVGGAEASLEDDTSPLPCTGRAHVWHPQTIFDDHRQTCA